MCSHNTFHNFIQAVNIFILPKSWLKFWPKNDLNFDHLIWAIKFYLLVPTLNFIKFQY
jgi:hypothetical protein